MFNEAKQLYGGVSFSSSAPFQPEYKALWVIAQIVYIVRSSYPAHVGVLLDNDLLVAPCRLPLYSLESCCCAHSSC